MTKKPYVSLLAPLLLSILVACGGTELSTSIESTQTPGTPVITDYLISGDEITVVWTKNSGSDAERWYLNRNNLLVCSDSLIADSTDGQQSGSCSFTLVEGSNSIYVQLCNSSGSGGQCTNSSTVKISHTPSDTTSTSPPGDIYLDQIPSLTSDAQLYVEWIKEQGVNGDYWDIYHNGQSDCSGELTPSDQQEQQSAGCIVDLPFGDHQLQARLCVDKPVGIEDLCTDSETYNLTNYFDSGRVLATPVIESLDASLPAWETTINWSKDDQDGSAGESWTFYHNDFVACTGTLTADEQASSCTLELQVGANNMYVQLCTTIATYSGASCSTSDLSIVDAFYPYALDPGDISLSTIFITQTYEPSITVNWEINSGNGVTEWYLQHNANTECFSTSSDYRTSGSCPIDLSLGANDISVVGCNYGAEDASSCTQSPVSSTELLELPGAPELTSPTETSTYTTEQTLRWQRTSGASAQSWFASVNGSDQCWDTELAAADEQSAQCDIALESGHNELQVRLCVVDSIGASYCSYSGISNIELLAAVPDPAVITTGSQTVSDDQITIEWSNSGTPASSWSLTNNGLEVAGCGTVIQSSGSTQSGSCSVNLNEGTNEIAVTLCNTNTAGTASCSTSESITIDRQLDTPEFTTSSDSISIDEHSAGIIYTPEVQDNDSTAAQISFTLLTVDDHSAFSLDSSSGAISPLVDLDHENPQDSDQNNVYQLQLEVADETGRGDSMTLQISVVNINDNPPQFNLISTSFSVAENTTAITSISASDADGDSLTYELVATGDFSRVTFDPGSGALAFDPAPDHEAPQDSDQNNVYELNLSASDGSYTTYTSLSITVANINEAPTFATASQDLPINENTSGSIYTASATDPEQATLTYSASGSDSSLFDLNSETGSLSFITTPDHESPQDSDQNNIYQLDLIASDGEYSASQALSITISNVNEPPVFATTSVSLSSAENNASFVHTIEAAIDPDQDQQLSYQLSGSDQSAFNLDPDTLELSFISVADYENPIDQDADNNYQISITATDGEYDTTQSLSITITDANEAPVFTSANAQAVDYTSVRVGDIVYTAVAIDADSDDEVRYALGGTDASHFDFNSINGALAFNQLPALEDFPSGESITYQIAITASDLANSSSVLDLSIILTDDTGTAPEFASASASVEVSENTSGIIYTAVATDVDPGHTLIYALSGNDSQAFSIDPDSGELSFDSIPDHENPIDQDANNVYELTISATDPLGKQAFQSLSVSVTNANDTYPQFTLSSNSFSVVENTSAVTTISATDVDGDTLTFALITNADANYFVLDPTSGALAFDPAPDYESPQDSGSNNVYELDLSAFDGKHTTYAAISITVTNINEAPSFATASQDLSVNENSSGSIYTASATDPEQASLTYSASGADLDLFNFNASSGSLSFIASPNYENPLDQDSNNIYQLSITASDGEYSSSQDLSISVANVNEPPVFTTTSVDLSSAENASFVHTVEAATDEDQGQQLTYTISGTDQADFNFDPATRQLSFVVTPNYENPQDSGRNNNYQVSITVSDGVYTDVQSLSISVTDVNEPPSFANTNVDLTSAENNTGFRYTVAAAIDEDQNEQLIYQLTGTDAADFSFNTSTRELLFAATPNYENPLDNGRDNNYQISITASDSEYSTTQDISITVTDVNEAPSFTNSNVDLEVAESNANFVYTVEAAIDEDQGQQLTYTISGADVADFSFDADTLALRFLTTPDYENPLDSNANNSYLLRISVSDGQYSDNQDLTISVTNVNEAPSFTNSSVSLSTEENNANFVHTVEAASDPDQGQALTYQLSGNDKDDFSLDANTRVLSFINPPDYEQPSDANSDNIYQISVIASDGALSSSQDISISVSGLNDESPLFTSLNSQAIEYTSVQVGDIVYIATSTDPDTNDVVSYALSGSDASHFDFDSSSGELAFKQLPTMEEFLAAGGIAYQLTITATDLANNSSVLNLTINLVDDTGVAPEFTSANVMVDVNENNSGVFYQAQATDADGDTLTYSLSGVDYQIFNIDSSSGALSFNSAPDYEAAADYDSDNTYDLTVIATDPIAKQAQQNLTVNVINLNDNYPLFELATNFFDVAENTSAVTTVAASDADGDSLTFSLAATSADSGFFTIGSSSGVLAFISAPDYENPQDSDSNNIYQLKLNVSDGSYTTSREISITVTNIDEAPSFATASESLSVSENTSASVYQAQATDPEQATLTYSASGSDASLFTLDSSSGELSFTSAPDFEIPLDANADNIYQLDLAAFDGVNSASQALSVTITDVNEPHSFASTSVSLTSEENNASFAYTAEAASDPDQGQTLTYQLSGSDQSAFNFDPDTRILGFKTDPDYESPADQNNDNTYQISIIAFDADHSASQDLSISVTNLNDEAPQFTSLSSQAVNYTAVEVGDIVYTAQAVDPDPGDQVSYALSGADASSFTFDSSSGALAFAQLPSLAEFQSSNGGIAYALTITATDLANNSSVLDLTINLVDDTGSAPEFTQASANISVDENIVGVIYQAAASDADGDPIAYSLEGTDAAAFTIDSSSGELSFNSPPDHELPADDDGNNVYELTIIATDSPVGNQAQQSLAVSINNLNDNAPQFNLSSIAFSIIEGETSVTTITAQDADGDDLTFSLTNTTDSSFFSLGSSSGVLAFASAPDFEYAQDSNTDNTYELELSVFDGSHTTTEEITITVTNVDESPSFASATQNLSVNENTSGSVYQAQATDPEQATLSYSASGTDAGLFDLDSASGVLSFKATPDFEAPIDSGADNVYELSISASDGANSASQALTITVTNVNEAPSFTSTSVNLDTDENDASFTHTVDAATDPDSGQTLAYQLGGDDAVAFDFDTTTRALAFKQSPNYESPQDQDSDNAYQIDIIASDGEYETTQSIAIAVTDLNDESPQFTSLNLQTVDYTTVQVGDIVYTAQADDADAGDQISYALGGADAANFDFDSSTGELSFNQLPNLEDFPTDGGIDYQLSITATDLAANSTDLALTISLLDDTGTAPTFAQASVSINVDENVIGSVYTAQATDVDVGDTLSYSISGTDSSYFTIDPSSGDLNFNTAPDYESPSDDGKDNTYELSITATDSMAKQAQQSLTISINNLNDNAPQFDLSANSFDVAENTTAVTTVSASDADGDDLTFSLTNSTDSNLFTLDSTSGALAFISAPDFETPQDSNADNTYDLELNVFDGANTTTQSISVTVTNVDESPSFASASQSLSVSENSSGAVYQAQASDPEQATLTYSASGTDAELFTINSSSGELSFKTPPDFETPGDSGADNTYNLTITATDGASQASQSLSITVTNVNEAPSFASTSVSLDIDENDASFTHIVDSADDPDQGETLTYQLGGDDAADFNFDSSTRSLSFANTPDFETPADQDSDNAYQIDIIASDGEYETTQSIAIVVTDLNDEAPQFTSASSLVLDYTSVVVGTTIYTAQATDADAGDSVVYTLGGADSSAFSFDSSSGELAFTQLPSLDSPQDDNGDNSYELVITATDSAGNSNDLDLSINVVDDTGSAPTFDQASVSINVDENTASSVYTAQATDSDPGDTLTYSISGTDSSLFTINPSSGDLSFQSAPDYENPSDSDADNTYELTITATDSIGKQATQSLAITVTNINDNAPQFALSANSFDVAENTTAVTIVSASDADGDDLTFSLTNSTDSNLFSLDSSSGVLAFASAPDFENPADNNADNTYELELSVFDGANTTTQSISVTVTNVDESPSFASASQSLSVSENSSGAVYQAQASDPEGATLTYSASGTDAELFTINSSSGELSFKTPPDFETPGDSGADNTYNLTITATDGANQVNQSLSITVTNVNEAPSFASASVNLDIDENDASFTHTVDAADDPDSGQTLAYQLGGDDAADFNFDSSTRALSFKQTPDFESPTDQGANNVYQITITASDADYSTTQAITITVADLNDEAPQFTSAASLALDYTSVVVGTTIYTVQATDADAGDSVVYTLSGTDQQHFSFAASSGALAFSELPSLENPKDADKDNIYQLSIAATDSAGNSNDLDLSINVVDDTGSAPVFTQASVSINVDENTASAIYTAQATDVDPGDSLTYSIDGTDAELFTINSSSGELSFNSAPDFENPSDNGKDNTYDLTITANDSIGKQASQSLAITVTNINDNAPQFALSSSTFDVPENTTAITTVAANDVDGDDLTFSLTNSTDASFFSLDSTSGVLAFASAPDFENPADNNADNTYDLELNVFDGANTTTQSVSVTVTNIDEAPGFASANESLSVNENTSGSVYQAQASDPEGTSLTYSASGADASLFTLDSISGELSFKQSPNYEQATDQDGDNVYELTITAADAANQVSQSLAITVTNVNEAPTFASTSVNLNTDENDASFTHTVDAASDEDSGQTLTYALSGDDAADFNFDASTRSLAFKTTPDYESPADQNTDNAYQIDIIASDGDLEATQAITITVANVEESPYFHSSADHVEITEDPATEGTASPVLALSIQAADDEDDLAGTSLNFVISGGADSDKFSLTAVDANSANLFFKTSPDFDNPHDSNLDSNYSLSIQVADSSGAQAQHDVIVQVLGVNDEVPQLSSGASADVTENSTAIFYVASATDADRSDWSDSDSSKHYQPNLDSITFSLDTNGYPDSSFFSINSSSGDLQATSGLDYETPQSSAQSNNYTVSIKVADQAGNSSTSPVTITVIDDPDEPEPVASSGPQIPWFYSDVSVGESIDIPWVIYSGDGAISWSMLVNGTTVCSESASISAPVTSGTCSVSSNYLSSGSNLNTTEVSVTYSDSSSESSEQVSFAYAVSATTSRYPTPTASVSDGIAACQNVDIGDEVSATSNVDCWNFLLGNDDFGGPYDEVPSYLTANYGRGFDVIAYYGDWSIYERGFQPAHMPVNLLSTALYSFIMLDGDIPATQAANADEKECEDCSFSGAVDFADYYSAIHKAYSLPDDPLATDKWLGTEGVGDGYVAYGTGIGEHWTDDSAYKGNGIFKQFWLLKQKFPHFKTCISVGGWSFSRPFPLIASDSTKLATFVESITDMAVKYHFDCIDIDWEFPGKAGGDYVNNNSAVVYDYDGDGKTPFITPTAADAGYFVNLISALRAELDSRSEASHIEINSAVYTSEDGMALMDYNAFAGNLDGIHMMTYDYYGAWDAHTGLQAALYANSDPVHSEVSVLHGDVYNNKHNIASAMARAVNNAIDNGFGSNHDIRRKIVPGLAFYGRNYSGVSTTPVPGKYMVLANSAAEQLSWEQGNLNYIQIEGYYEDGATMSGNSAYDAGGYNTAGRSWTYRWDSESMAPFLYDASRGSFIGYTDPRATFYQTCHAARENSKGVMFWEMTQDSSDFHLVEAIHTAIRGDTLTQYADQPHCDDIIDRDTTSNNDDGGNGGDTGGGNDDDGGDTGGGDTGGDTSSGTSGLQELEDLGYFTETVFNSLFYNTTLNQGSSTDGACTGYSFFNNWLDLKEAATYYPDFAAEGSMEDRLRELAAFLANTSHETTGAWQTYALDPALGARYHYGYCFKEEVGCENQTSCTQYCDSANTEYGYACSLGTTYHGRGPIQFTWNYNYGAMSEVLYGNNNYTLLENPSILVTDAVISYRSALWFWMTVQAPKPSAHDVMIGNYSAEASKNRYPGFGMTINIINGGLECGTDDFAEAKNKNRLGFYLAYLKVLGDAYGSEISPWVTESSTSTTHGSTPATYSAFDLNEADLISRYTDVETYLSCKNMEHY